MCSGPNSIARCNIDPGSNGVYRVSFIPLETGNYNVFVRFNGQEVNGVYLVVVSQPGHLSLSLSLSLFSLSLSPFLSPLKLSIFKHLR